MTNENVKEWIKKNGFDSTVLNHGILVYVEDIKIAKVLNREGFESFSNSNVWYWGF